MDLKSESAAVALHEAKREAFYEVIFKDLFNIRIQSLLLRWMQKEQDL